MLWKKHLMFGAVLAMALVLLMGSTWRIVRGPSVSYAATAATRRTVSLSGEPIGQSSAATADFNGDGRKEIVIGGQDGRLYVISYTGTSGSVVWSRQVADDLNAAGAPSTGCATTKSDIRSAPAVGDLDGDGHLEIVVTTGGDPAQHRNGGVLVYRYTSSWSFALVSGWPQPKLDIVGLGGGASDSDGCWDGIWGSPALGDVDGDGDLEVAVEGFDRRLHLWHHNGTYVTGWPIQRPTITRGGWSTPAIADLDRDGLPELVFGTDHTTGSFYNLYAFNGDASILPGFPVETTQNIMSAPALGDINGDGWLEIVVGGGGYEASVQNKVYAWDHNGSLLPGWPKDVGGNTPASPALGDLDGDGDLEIVIGCGAEGDPYNPAPCTLLYAWHGNGSLASGFPTSPQNNTGWPADPNGLPYSPILADYDGDGSVEIMVVNRWSWGISTVAHNGGNHNDSTLRTDNTLSSSPVVDDVDNDGKLEIIIGGANSSGTSGVVYIWDGLNGSTASAPPWPMFHHDARRTGNYAVPSSLAFPPEVRLYHQSGSGSTESTSPRLENKGDGSFDWRITHSIAQLQVIPSSGVVMTIAQPQFLVTTAGLSDGWHNLGTVTVTGTVSGRNVVNSPRTAVVWVYIGDVDRVYLPITLRNH